ncbi:hypothetical protein DFH06DRAFT_673665 [Mycena polygramma]|nr:hypothetical protein DFH06DRAFT_673665 [Mycena polygramma]
MGWSVRVQACPRVPAPSRSCSRRGSGRRPMEGECEGDHNTLPAESLLRMRRSSAARHSRKSYAHFRLSKRTHYTVFASTFLTHSPKSLNTSLYRHYRCRPRRSTVAGLKPSPSAASYVVALALPVLARARHSRPGQTGGDGAHKARALESAGSETGSEGGA